MFLPVPSLILHTIMFGSHLHQEQHTSLPQCRDVTLHAAYLAEAKLGDGAGFLVEISNDRAVPIVLPDPVPLSIHWYAFSGGRWLWRSSSGAGGALVNADREGGPVFAMQLPERELRIQTIATRSKYSWTALARTSPALRYRPGCEHCGYTGDNTFRAVLAYAILPSDAASATGLLQCGLRSKPVIMPPLPADDKPHNSGR